MAGRQRNASPPKPFANGAGGAGHGDDPEIIVEGDATTEVVIDDAGGADEGVESLRAQLQSEREKREAAEARAAELATERSKDQQVITDSRLLVIESTIQTKQGQKEALIKRIKEAKEAGDIDAETTAVDELQMVNIELRQATLGKDRLEQEIKDGTAKGGGDAIAAYTKDMPPRSAQWIRDHPDYVTDQDKQSDLVAAHYSALSKKLVPNSTAYFEHIEQELGMRDSDDGGQQEQRREEPATRRTLTPPAAPVSRAGFSGPREIFPGITETAPGKFNVTKEVAEAAAISGVTVAEYIERARGLKRGPDGQLH